MEQDYVYTSMDNDYHMIRNIVAKRKEFKERDAGQLAADLIDNKATLEEWPNSVPHNHRHLTERRSRRSLDEVG